MGHQSFLRRCNFSLNLPQASRLLRMTILREFDEEQPSLRDSILKEAFVMALYEQIREGKP
jgi:hypothetical protein